jgi:hypothetical protein
MDDSTVYGFVWNQLRELVGSDRFELIADLDIEGIGDVWTCHALGKSFHATTADHLIAKVREARGR